MTLLTSLAGSRWGWLLSSGALQSVLPVVENMIRLISHALNAFAVL
ncbi:hypothetical protein [Pantoea sp. A4]|nr:hypothetical protein [Pantoea sp. A4]